MLTLQLTGERCQECDWLRDILQLVKDRLNNGSLTQQQAVIQQHQLLFHAAFELGNELNARGLEQLFGELLRK
jgi:hypothetical protein